MDTGGLAGLRDVGALEASVMQPQQTFEGKPLYSSLIDKAAALCYSLVLNHPFIDGNKRIAHAAMEAFLMLNGCEIHASVEEQEQLMLNLANGRVSREELITWLEQHVVPFAERGQHP